MQRSVATRQAARVETPLPVADVDPELREYLREWRRGAAKQDKIASFVVMHDSSLDEICRQRPASLAEIRGVSGFGERKTERYGQQILHALAEFNEWRACQRAYGSESRSQPKKPSACWAKGTRFLKIANLRGRQLGSVVGLIANLVEKGELQFQPEWVDEAKLVSIEEACARLGTESLKPLKDALPPDITYEEIRLVVARLRSQQQKTA